VGGESKHLDIEQIERLLSVQPSTESFGESTDLDDARLHLLSCELCQRLVSMERESDRGLRGLRLASPEAVSVDCPPKSRFYELVGGLIERDDSEKLMSHASECDHCGPILRQIAEDMAAERTAEEEQALASLMTSQMNWQKIFAQRLAFETGKSEVATAVVRERHASGGWSRLRWAFAGATAVIVCVVFVWIGASRTRPGYAEGLLATAYAEHRTLEFRIPNARFGPLRVTRGSQTSNLNKPSSLLRAEALIGSSLEKDPDSVDWLQAKARADLLDGSYEAAIQTLKRALELRPDDPALLTDLASAYGQRAEDGRQPSDYGDAIELLGRALALIPDDSVALYNRAIVSERAFLFKQAEADWQHYLRVDPTGDWANDARKHLQLLQEEMIDHDRRSSRPLLGYEEFATAKIQSSSDFENSIDARLEDYIDLATSEWLPAAFPQGYDPGDRKSHARLATEILAGLAKSRHEDPWLTDLLSDYRGNHFPEALAALSQSLKANKEGNYSVAQALAMKAAQLFENDGNRAGLLRAHVENMFTLHLSHDAQTCVRNGNMWTKEVENSSYRWTQVQFGLEYGLCVGILGRYGDAKRSVGAAVELAKNCGYTSAHLRGLGILSDLASTLGNVRQGWMLAAAGLTSYWSGTFQPMLGYNLYTDLDTAAGAKRQPHLQVAIWEQALALIDSDSDPLLRAMAHSWMARAAVEADMHALSEKEFLEASRWFAAAPQNDATRNDRMEVETLLAEVEDRRGSLDEAYTRLIGIKAALESGSNHYLAIKYYAIKGVVESERNMPHQAEQSLEEAVLLAEEALKSLSSDRERSLWNEEASDAYRNLAQVKLESGDIETALEIWEWYKGAPLRFLEPRSGGEIQVETSSVKDDADATIPPQRQSLPSLNEVQRSLSNLHNETVISYGIFGDAVWIWTFDDRGILAKRAESSAGEIGALANRFADLCSSSDSDVSAIRRDGLKLYELLVAPVEERISGRNKVVFELDGAIARVPMEALLNPSATYLVDRASISVSPGLYYRDVIRPDQGLSPQADTLVVAVPAPSGVDSAGLMPLVDAEREADIVAATFGASRLLRRSEATLDTVGKLMRGAQVFHFSGHAISLEGEIGLVLTDSNLAENPRLLDASFIDREQLDRMQLAVLSACTTDSLGSDARAADDLGMAFVRGGVPNVLESRWNVDSAATSALMENFYRELLGGKGVPESLRSAEIKLRAHPQFAHPYYWASFQVLQTP
jgi:CHAT domain-containing protein